MQLDDAALSLDRFAPIGPVTALENLFDILKAHTRVRIVPFNLFPLTFMLEFAEIQPAQDEAGYMARVADGLVNGAF